jgi:hypothetical protein
LKTSHEDSVQWKFEHVKVESRREVGKLTAEQMEEWEDMFMMAMEEYERDHGRWAREFEEGCLSGLMGLDLGLESSQMGEKVVIPPLEGCLRDHEDCKRKEVTQLPNRVIDVGTGPNLRARLYEPKEGECAPYVTLSHCWGGEVPDKLLSSNIAEYLEILEVDKLPRTFADAIRLVQRLGYRYLWIDALCIQQDSFSEWEHEAAIMSFIYSNSVFTISGLDSVNSRSGLYSQFHDDSDWVDINSEGSTHTLPAQPSEPEKKPRIKDSHKLNTRGWTLQERLLTPANLHFLNGNVIWECRTYVLYPSGTFQTSDPFLKRLLPSVAASRSSFGNISKSLLWARLVESYSHRQLTKPFDKLIAVAGLARTIQGTFDTDVYYAGMWEGDFPMNLLWTKAFNNVERVREYRAPSWSWASVDGAIKFPVSYTSRNEMWHPDDLRIIRINVTEHIPGSLGSVTAGYMEVEGLMYQLTSQQESKCREFMDTYLSPFMCYALKVGTFSTVNAFSKLCWLLLEPRGHEFRRVGAVPPERFKEPFDAAELGRGMRQIVRIV